MKPQHIRETKPLGLTGWHNLSACRSLAETTTKVAVGAWLGTFLLLAAAVWCKLTHGDVVPAVYVTAASGALGLLGIIASLRMTCVALDDWRFVRRLEHKRWHEHNWRG